MLNPKRLFSILAVAFISLAATGAFAKTTTHPVSGHQKNVATHTTLISKHPEHVKQSATKKQPNTRKVVTMTKSNGKIYTHQKL